MLKTEYSLAVLPHEHTPQVPLTGAAGRASVVFLLP